MFFFHSFAGFFMHLTLQGSTFLKSQFSNERCNSETELAPSQEKLSVISFLVLIMRYSDVTWTMEYYNTDVLYKELILSFAFFPIVSSDTVGMFESCLWPCSWSTSVKIMIHEHTFVKINVGLKQLWVVSIFFKEILHSVRLNKVYIHFLAHY